MTAWHRLTHLIQRIIAYALLGILICTFILPKGITRTSYAPGANSDSNSFVEVDQVAKAGATNDPFLFRQIQISHFSYAYFHIDENSTPASVHSKYFASNRLRKSSSSSRILPKTKSLPDKKRCSTIVLAYDPGIPKIWRLAVIRYFKLWFSKIQRIMFTVALPQQIPHWKYKKFQVSVIHFWMVCTDNFFCATWRITAWMRDILQMPDTQGVLMFTPKGTARYKYFQGRN